MAKRITRVDNSHFNSPNFFNFQSRHAHLLYLLILSKWQNANKKKDLERDPYSAAPVTIIRKGMLAEHIAADDLKDAVLELEHRGFVDITKIIDDADNIYNPGFGFEVCLADRWNFKIV